MTLLCAAAVVTGCKGTKEATAYDHLISQQWLLEQVVYDDSTVTAPKNVYATFTDSTYLYGRGACNTFIARFETPAAGEISIAPGPMTLMMCLDMEFENRYMGELKAVSAYEATAHELKMYDAMKTFTLVYKPMPENYNPAEL